MKLKFFTILAATCALSASAYDFSAQVTNENGQTRTLYFDWVTYGQTCQTAAGPEAIFHSNQMSIQLEGKLVDNTWVNGETIFYDVYTIYMLADWGEAEYDGPNASWDNYIYLPEKVTTDVDGEPTDVRIIGIGDYSFVRRNLHLKNFVIPDHIQYIGKGAFFGMDFDDGITIGKGLTEIGDYAFYNCNFNYYDINIPNTVNQIGKYAFGSCSNIANVTIGEGDPLYYDKEGNLEGTVIGEGAFHAVNPQSITIGDAVITIMSYAFFNCKSTSSILLGENLVDIQDYAFFNCSGPMTTLIIPDKVKWIGNYAFYYCTSLGYMVIGKSVISIGDYAFYEGKMDQNDHLELPATLEELGMMAFSLRNTNQFADLYCYALDPPEIASEGDNIDDMETFGKIGGEETQFPDAQWIYANVCLHVPQGTVEDYRKATGWKNFKCIIEDLVDIHEAFDLIIGYEFMVPGEEIDIYDALPQSAKDKYPDKTQLLWDIDLFFNKPVTPDSAEDDIMRVEKRDNSLWVIAKDFGQKVANCMIMDAEGHRHVVGYVAIFVCPTITLQYNNVVTYPDTDQGQTKAPALGADNAAKGARTRSLASNADVTYGANYQHRVVYNSYPQVDVAEPKGIEIESILSGEADETGMPAGELNNVNYDSTDHIVPQDPVTTNRVIVLNTLLTDENLGTTGVQEVEIGSDIRVLVDGQNITIVGADDQSPVTVCNVNGQLIYRSAVKSFTLATKGVYIIQVENVTFKALVK